MAQGVEISKFSKHPNKKISKNLEIKNILYIFAKVKKKRIIMACADYYREDNDNDDVYLYGGGEYEPTYGGSKD